MTLDFLRGRDRTRTARPRRRRGNQSPSGALIRARFPTARNVYRDDYRFVVDGTGLEQQQRPQRNRKFHSAGGYSSIGKYGILGSTNRNLSGRGPSILLCKTVLSLKSPTGAFIAALRFANANLYIKENIDEAVFMFALFKCRKSDKGRN